MNDESKIDPGHNDLRAVLRFVGPLVAIVGIALIGVGVGSFFSAFASFGTADSGPPRYFWCVFLGIPVLGVGAMISQMAYLGRFARYLSGEVAPVQKDTFNYLAEGTAPGVRTMAEAVGGGLRSGMGSVERPAACPKCQAPNSGDARFCTQCGTDLGEKSCPRCGRGNDPSARFCNGCGGQLV